MCVCVCVYIYIYIHKETNFNHKIVQVTSLVLTDHSWIEDND